MSLKIGNYLGLTRVAADPAAPAEGDLWYNTTDQRMRVRDATTTEPLGVAADAAAVGFRHRRAAGAWVYAPMPASGLGTPVLTAGTVYYTPHLVTRPGGQPLQGWGPSVVTAATGATLRVAAYTADRDTGVPATLITQGPATLDGATTGVKTLTQTLTLPVGWAWLALVAQGGNPTVQGVTGRFAIVQHFSSAGMNALTTSGYISAANAVTSGAFPTTAPTVAATGTAPEWALQLA